MVVVVVDVFVLLLLASEDVRFDESMAVDLTVTPPYCLSKILRNDNLRPSES